MFILGAIAVASSACIELVGIEEPTLVQDITQISEVDHSWPLWPMPNPSKFLNLPNPSSYTVDEVNDVVVDNVTGLMWQRTVTMDPGQIQQSCLDLVLAGHNDWRTPSRIELVSIVDFSRVDPAIDTDAFPNTPNTLFMTGEGHPFSVDFHDGSSYPVYSGIVRCVR